MVTNNCLNFINYNYISFNKIQAIKRLGIIWLLSIFVKYFFKNILLINILLIAIPMMVSIIFLFLIIRYFNKKISRFLSDGVFYTYVSFLLNYTSYKLLTFNNEKKPLLCIILIALLIFCIILLFYLTKRKIKFGLYNGTQKQVSGSYSFVGAILGIIFCEIFLKDISILIVYRITAGSLLILSFITSIMSINFLKVYYCFKLDNV